MAASLGGIILYFLKLTAKPEVLWNVLPLAITAILIIVYFEKYRDERPEGNTFLTTSLVLIFVSMNLFRYIHGLSADGFYNFVDYPAKTIATALLLLVGSLTVRFNFEHLLPEKFSKHLSSSTTVHLVAYAVILFVYSSFELNWEVFFALLIIVVSLTIILHLFKMPLRRFFEYTRKQKEKERLKDAKEAKFQIDELKEELKYRNKELRKIRLKEAEREKKEALGLKKALRGIKSGKRKKHKKR